MVKEVLIFEKDKTEKLYFLQFSDNHNNNFFVCKLALAVSFPGQPINLPQKTDWDKKVSILD